MDRRTFLVGRRTAEGAVLWFVPGEGAEVEAPIPGPWSLVARVDPGHPGPQPSRRLSARLRSRRRSSVSMAAPVSMDSEARSTPSSRSSASPAT